MLLGLSLDNVPKLRVLQRLSGKYPALCFSLWRKYYLSARANHNMLGLGKSWMKCAMQFFILDHIDFTFLSINFSQTFHLLKFKGARLPHEATNTYAGSAEMGAETILCDWSCCSDNSSAPKAAAKITSLDGPSVDDPSTRFLSVGLTSARPASARVLCCWIPLSAVLQRQHKP